MKIISLKNLLFTCVATALVGCGDSETNITETAATPEEHQHEDLGKGRLAIADAEHALVHIFDLDDNDLVESVAITNPAESLYASPEHRYAVAVQRSFDTVEFIDGGLWQELHGDHFDQHVDTPELSSFSLFDVKPTHVVPRGEQVAIFFDGNKDTGADAALSLFTDESIASEKVIAHHLFNTYQHGTAEARGDYVLTTLRESDAEGTLPNQVALLEVHGDHFHQEQLFIPTCPSLHGSFQTSNYIAFACEDGILAIKQTGDEFTAEKITNPENMPESVRINSLSGSDESDVMIGSSRAGFFLVDLVTEQISSFDWQPEVALTSVTYGFDGHQEHMLILDNTGQLNVFSAEDNWQLDKRIPVFNTLAEDAKPRIIASKTHEIIYIINQQKVTEIDLDAGEVVGSFDVNFVPGHAVWLGVAAEETHAH